MCASVYISLWFIGARVGVHLLSLYLCVWRGKGRGKERAHLGSTVKEIQPTAARWPARSRQHSVATQIVPLGNPFLLRGRTDHLVPLLKSFTVWNPPDSGKWTVGQRDTVTQPKQMHVCSATKKTTTKSGCRISGFLVLWTFHFGCLFNEVETEGALSANFTPCLL